MSITKDQFERALNIVVDGRKKLYSTAHAFHFRWEDDNTRAERDQDSFTELAELLNFPKPEEYIIPKQPFWALTPGFEVQGKIGQILVQAVHDPGDTIVMIHYSGHGRQNALGNLELVNLSGKVIAADGLLRDLYTDRLVSLHARVDVVVILDCCFSFLASRTANSDHRRVDILCANEERVPIALGAGTSQSFTSKILTEARWRAQNGHTIIEMSNLIETLCQTSPRKKAHVCG